MTPIPRAYFAPRYWGTWLGLGLLRLFSALPLPVVWLLGAALGELMYTLVPSRRHIASRNIRACFPALTAAEQNRLIHRHFRALGQALLTIGMPWWLSPRRIRRMVRYRNREYYDQALAAGKNIILLAPHFIGLEHGMFLSSERPVVFMYQRPRNPLFELMMRRGRMRYGGQLVERDASLKGLIRRLRAGVPLVSLPDQNAGAKRGVFVPFMGITVATHPAVGRLAALGHALVIPCIVRQLPRGRGYEIGFRPPLTDFPSGDPETDARRMNHEIEEALREMPEQYMWVHKRFKVRPKGSPDFYA